MGGGGGEPEGAAVAMGGMEEASPTAATAATAATTPSSLAARLENEHARTTAGLASRLQAGSGTALAAGSGGGQEGGGDGGGGEGGGGEDSGGGGGAAGPEVPELRVALSDLRDWKEIGTGSFSTVYAATLRGPGDEPGRLVAVKVLRQALIVKENKVAAVMREKDVMLGLRSHPLIVHLHATLRDREKLYFVMAYCANGDLQRYTWRYGVLADPAVHFYAGQLILALEFLAARHIVHRDLKPENLLLDDRMYIKVTDFGSVKVLEPGTVSRRNSFMGTAEYVSPEVLESLPVTRSADLWAFGVILVQLFTASLAFQRGTGYLTFKAITELDYTLPADLPEPHADLVRRLLLIDPEQRLGARSLADLRGHPFFAGLNWAGLTEVAAPVIDAFLPACSGTPALTRGPAGACEAVQAAVAAYDAAGGPAATHSRLRSALHSDAARTELRAAQVASCPWHSFLEPDEVVVQWGALTRRTGYKAAPAHLVLTDAPRLLLMDPDKVAEVAEMALPADCSAQLMSDGSTLVLDSETRLFYLAANPAAGNNGGDGLSTTVAWVDAITQMSLLAAEGSAGGMVGVADK